MKTLTGVILAITCLTGCKTPDLRGLSKDERRFVLEQSAQRRATWRAVGIGFLNFGLQTAANSIDPNRGGFAK